jgi:hypothetical protein
LIGEIGPIRTHPIAMTMSEKKEIMREEMHLVSGPTKNATSMYMNAKKPKI